MRKYYLFIILIVFTTNLSATTYKEITDSSVKSTGFFTSYWQEKSGKMYLEIEVWNEEFLMVSYLSRGMGSNDVGLDRGKIGEQKIVAFQRHGDKVLLTEPNYRFRADSEDNPERKAVEESFARSVIWGFSAVAEKGGKVLIDITDLLLSDQNRVISTLTRSNQGSYKVDPSRSAINMDRTRNFPDNSEFDAILTFSGNPDGAFIREVVPTARHMTLGQHLSFVRLPESGGYTPRVFEPGSGYISLQYVDLATPLGKPSTKRFIYRHSLKKKDPSAALSEAVEPIIYYLDPGTPEPVRSALLDGASWWNEAFEAIGYKDAFRIELLPPKADPLDIRYNVIQWVHRSSRGWSYGSSVVDPRTGEILKGHVSLGSQRVRQDYMIAEAILSPYDSGNDIPDEMEEMALARLRQLSAHEVGHTLGFAHNYIASADKRASVMDYPHPLVSLKDGKIELSAAYDVGIGAWDKVYVAYGYQDFPVGTDEESALKKILEDARNEGLRFLSDQDARPEGSAHPSTHLWDNGEDAGEELERVIELRKKILEQFSEKSIQKGVPYAEMEDLLVPAYMFHRYQLEAAVKTIGGLTYNYALRGEPLQNEMVSPEAQSECLERIISTLDPEFLAVPKEILALIPPKPLDYYRDRENFKSRTEPTFDPLSAAEASAELTIKLLLNPQRASRLVVHQALEADQPGLHYIIDELINKTWKAANGDHYFAEVKRVVDNLLLHHLMMLSSDLSATTQARAVSSLKIDELESWISAQNEGMDDIQLKAHYSFALKRIAFFKSHPDLFNHETPLAPPPGQPIGDCGLNHWN